jgi:hypothetical protein
VKMTSFELRTLITGLQPSKRPHRASHGSTSESVARYPAQCAPSRGWIARRLGEIFTRLKWMLDKHRVPAPVGRTRDNRIEPILSSITKAMNKSRSELSNLSSRLDSMRVDAAFAHDWVEDAPPCPSVASHMLYLAERDLVSGEEWQRHLTGELRFLEHLEAEVAAFARARPS